MTSSDRDDWLPLSRRDAPARPGALLEGVPEHLDRPLVEWGIAYLDGHQELLKRVALQLRMSPEGQDAEHFIAAARSENSSRLLDLLDAAIHLDLSLRWELDVRGPTDNRMEASLADWISDYRWEKGGRAEPLERLDEMLADGGSAYEVDWHRRRLVRRVDAVVAAAGEMVMANQQSNHLRAAWTAAYGRHPDPDKAYDEAVRAVEAAAIPVLLPNGSRETLGKALAHIRQASHKWQLAIEGRNGGAVDPLVAMIQLLWEGQQRHAGAPTSRPQRQDEAEMAVHLATTIVHWFATGGIRRRTPIPPS